MRIIIFGADGYLGWPTSMKLASEGHEIIAVDNYLRRQMADETNSQPLMDNPKLEERSDIYYSNIGKKIKVEIGDCTDYKFVKQLFKEYQPDAVIHYAEQPSAPYSMMGHFEATRTLRNNLDSTLNIIFGVILNLSSKGYNVSFESIWLEKLKQFIAIKL